MALHLSSLVCKKKKILSRINKYSVLKLLMVVDLLTLLRCGGWQQIVTQTCMLLRCRSTEYGGYPATSPIAQTESEANRTLLSLFLQ